jgi:hypothetical protein
MRSVHLALRDGQWFSSRCPQGDFNIFMLSSSGRVIDLSEPHDTVAEMVLL